jgi:hypothetical protein
MSSFRSDVLLALRGMAAHPIFSALVAVTLGLGIGANAAIFSAMNGLLLRPSPFKDSERLIQISAVRGDAEGPLAVPELDDLKALPAIEDAAMYTDQGMYNASGFGTPEELPATITNSNLFRVLGVEPLVGSTFSRHLRPGPELRAGHQPWPVGQEVRQRSEHRRPHHDAGWRAGLHDLRRHAADVHVPFARGAVSQ